MRNGSWFLILASLALTSCASPWQAMLEHQADSLTASEEAGLKATLNAPSSGWYLGAEPDPKSGVQRGIVILKDGQTVRFAFLSHHLTDDGESHSVFKAPHYSRHITGGFYCEVMFPKTPQPSNLQELDAILNEASKFKFKP